MCPTQSRNGKSCASVWTHRAERVYNSGVCGGVAAQGPSPAWSVPPIPPPRTTWWSRARIAHRHPRDRTANPRTDSTSIPRPCSKEEDL